MTGEKQGKKETLEDQVTKVVIQVLMLKGESQKQVTLDADFLHDLGADSLDCVELRMKFEEVFKIDIEDGHEKEVTTVRKAAEYVRKQRAV